MLEETDMKARAEAGRAEEAVRAYEYRAADAVVRDTDHGPTRQAVDQLHEMIADLELSVQALEEVCAPVVAPQPEDGNRSMRGGEDPEPPHAPLTYHIREATARVRTAHARLVDLRLSIEL